MQSAIKQLIQLIGQSGGTVALPISELRELGVEITLENICDERNGRVVLRLGPKIYYVPQAEPVAQTLELSREEVEEQWPSNPQSTKPLRTSSSAPPLQPPPRVNQVDLEMEAIQRITNRPRARKTPVELGREVARRVQKQPPREVREEGTLPYAKVGVHHLNDMELWLQEQVRGETIKTRERANRAGELRTGDLPFRTMPGR